MPRAHALPLTLILFTILYQFLLITNASPSHYDDALQIEKLDQVPQLTSTTSMVLGCDPRSYSRAGYDMVIWYCAIAVGRPSLELTKMREAMSKVEETLYENIKNASLTPALDALKRNRLTFVWLDCEKQKNYWQIRNGEHICEKKDTPRLFVIRYLRNSIVNVTVDDDFDLASQLETEYMGAVDDVSKITLWLSSVIKIGDSENLKLRNPGVPYFVQAFLTVFLGALIPLGAILLLIKF